MKFCPDMVVGFLDQNSSEASEHTHTHTPKWPINNRERPETISSISQRVVVCAAVYVAELKSLERLRLYCRLRTTCSAVQLEETEWAENLHSSMCK